MTPGAIANLEALSGADGATNEQRTGRDVSWPELVGMVRRTVRRLAGPTRDIEDLTQAALEQVVRGVERYEGSAELTTFVYRIAVHVTMNHFRWWRRWRRRFDFGGDEFDLSSGDEALPSTLFAERERARRVHLLLEQLEPKMRMVIVLSDMEELPASRVAVILDCPEPTVRSRLRIARARLAALVRDDDWFTEEVRR